MTPEKQRIAIAEACGWTRVWDPAFRQWTQRSPNKAWVTCDPDPNADWEIHNLPDFINDLNAMHDAEKVLSDDQRNRYIITLCLEVQPEPMLYHATAAQRAEAFLRTIGKWEESA